MKTPKLLLTTAGMLCFLLALSGCPVNTGNGEGETAEGAIEGEGLTEGEPLDYREAMRNLVEDISAYAKLRNSSFAIVPQNGEALLTDDGTAEGTLASAYVAAIDGQGREDLFYGYDDDNTPTPSDPGDAMRAMMDLAEANDVRALIIDYCSTHAFIDNSYAQNASHGFLSFAAQSREANMLPTYPAAPEAQNTDDIASLQDAQNMLYLLNPGDFADRETYLNALAATNFDVFVIDFYYDDTPLSAAEVETLHTKANGGHRLLLSYMSIGEAESYRPYWQSGWTPGSPAWLDAENPYWAGNYKVHYWDPAWQAVLFGSAGAYLDQIIAAGFDGVYLDIIDAYEYYEGLNP